MELKISSKFKNVLVSMRNNKLAERLLSLENKESNSPYNYIDISDRNDIITFFPESKIKRELDNRVKYYTITNQDRYLKKFSPKNIKIFKELGYDPGTPNFEDYDCGYDTDYNPSNGTRGLILNEAVSETSGNTYCLFQYDGDRLIVFNKEAITETDNFDVFWEKNRNSIRIGRYANTILKDEFTSSDIENFVNEFKASYDVNTNELFKFKIVEGDDISYWYNVSNYVPGGGPLHNSCMCKSDPSFFDIYTKNKVKMVILYDKDNGFIKDGLYVADKIRGRALLWENVRLNGEVKTFMDRVYTINDSDVSLFKQLAVKNGWIYKSTQSMYSDDVITDGVNNWQEPKLIIELDCVDFDRYPFLDTLCYINLESKTASNILYSEWDRRLRTTGGGWESDDDDD